MIASPCRTIRLLICWSLVVGMAAAQTGPAPPAPVEGDVHALLIGCTEYPNLRPRYQLRGPGNDVALITSLLQDNYDFADDDIVTLVHDNDESMRPTHANIFREFAALIDRVQAGDSVFIMLGGHGSQLINDDPADLNDVELDGLDEVFLPEDVSGWRPGAPVEGAIRDDQIREWLDAIRDRGADVFFVADTCHSGTMDRAGDDEEEWDPNAFARTRHVPPEEINDPAQVDALRSAERADADLADVPAAQPAPAAGRGGLIALYAVDDRTLEQEHPMPPENDRSGPSYGRLSFAMNWVLTRSRRPLSYRELAQQIRWQYDGWDWTDYGFVLGTPDELDNEVLGQGRFERSSIVLSRDEYQRLSINAGLLHGATVGSIFAVYPTTIEFETADKPAGHVRVLEATPTTARVEPCEYEGLAAIAAAQLPAPGRCELAFAAHGSMKMTVAAAPLAPDFAIDAEDVAAILGDLAAVPGSLLQVAEAGTEPDAYALVDDRGIFLRKSYDPSTELDSDSADAAAEFPPGAFGPFAIEDGIGTDLHRALESMAKAVNLRSLATSDTEMLIGDPQDPVVRLEVQVARWNAETEAFEDVDPLVPLEAFDDDKLRVRVYNRGGAPVDLTILYVEAAFRIRSYFPTAMQDLAGGFNNRLTPERIPGEGEPAEVVFTINDTPIGLEDVIIIATVAEPGSPPQNFVFLEQPGLPVPRGDRGADDPPEAVDTPLGQLLASLAYGRGDRSGNAAADIAKYAVHRLSWTVKKGPVSGK